jgi:hypothetical protein
MGSSVFWHTMKCSLLKSTDVSEEHIASIFWVEEKLIKKSAERRFACYLLRAAFSTDLFLYLEDVGAMFFRNVG